MMITRRTAMAGIVTTAGLAAGRGSAADANFPSDAYARAIVIDGLGGFDDPYGKAGDERFTTRAIEEARRSGVTAVEYTVNEVGNAPDVWNKTIDNIAGIDRMIAANRDLLMPVLTVSDLRAAKASGRIGVFMGVQDTSMIGTQLDRLATLRGLGVRLVQLTYNLQNLSGDGSLEPANGGLSKLGRQTIARIEQEKLLLDLSHGGQRTIAEAIAATTRPPIISHTGARALNDNPRNVWDAELKACSDKGGVIGIFWMPYLVANSHATGADLVRHMTHIRNLCGEDHVAIGTDGSLYKTVIDAKARAAQHKIFEERTKAGFAAPGEGPDVFNMIAEWDDEMRFKHLSDGLARAGWTQTQIEKALGLNLLRLYGEVWAA